MEAIEISKKLGIGLEMSLVTNVLLDLREDDIEKLKESVKGLNGLSVHGPFRDLIIGSMDPDIREITIDRYVETIMISQSLGAEWVLFHLNYIPLVYSSERLRRIWLNNAVNSFEQILKLAVPIHIENTYEDDPKVFKDFFERLRSDKIFMCLDIGHAYAYSNIEISEWITVLSPYIREVHLHESLKGKDVHAALGSGYIDMSKVLTELENNCGNDLIITLEPANDEDLQRSIEWLREHGWIK